MAARNHAGRTAATDDRGLAAVDAYLTGRENLRMIGRLSGLSRSAASRRADELLELTGLAGAAGRAARTYPGGMGQMPVSDVTLPAGALEPRGLTTLVEGLTTALLRWEGAPGHASAVVGFVHELPSGAVNVGGKPAEPLIYRVSDRAAGHAGHSRPAQRAAPQ